MSDGLLHVFETDGPDTVIALDPDDAVKVWEESTGMKFDVEEHGGAFAPLSDNEQYTLFEEALRVPEPEPTGGVIVEQNADGSKKTSATCRAWADARGRCFLGSTEW